MWLTGAEYAKLTLGEFIFPENFNLMFDEPMTDEHNSFVGVQAEVENKEQNGTIN